MNIAVDIMGGDHAPTAVIDGLALAYKAYPKMNFTLVGDEKTVQEGLKRVGLPEDGRISIVHASQVVHMNEPSTTALRAKKDSSITVCANLMKAKSVDAVVSAGHTGAAVASMVLKARMLPGIERPGIASTFPTPTGPFVMLDVGANVDSKPLHLVQYGVMGEIYAREVLGIKAPSLGVLSIGEEDEKGNELSKATRKILAKQGTFNFIGNVEGNDLFNRKADVVVCDGFVGNVVLKTAEGMAKSMFATLKEFLFKNLVRKVGAMLSKSAFKELKALTDYAEYGGAPLMGINGICIIGHGSSSPKAIMNALRVAGEFVEHDVNNKIIKRWQQIEESVNESL